MSSMAVKSDARDWSAIVAGVLWFVTYFAARVLLKGSDLDTWQRVSIALLPVPFFAVFLWRVLTGVRGLDELERRIHLEALAVCYPLTLLFIMVLGLMQRAVALDFENWSYLHVWPYLVLFYIGGLAVAMRRYR